MSSETAYCFDSLGDVIATARWDSTQANLGVGSLVNCSSPNTPVTGANLTTATYDSYGNKLTQTDPRGILTQNTYGTVPACFVPQPAALGCTYGTNGYAGCTSAPPATTGFSCTSTTCSLSASSLYVTQTTVAGGTPHAETANHTYDCNTGLVDTDVDPNSVTTTYNYDAIGRQTLAQNPDTSVTTVYSDQFMYTATLAPVETTSTLSATIKRYDSLGRLQLQQQLETATSPGTTNFSTDQTSGIQTVHQYEYNGSNFYELVSNPFRNMSTDETMGWTLTTYDTRGRPISVQSFSGAGLPAPFGTNSTTTGTVRSAYDADTSASPPTERTTVTDQASNVRTAEYDALNRIQRVVEAGTYTTDHTYDLRGSLLTVTQGSGTGTSLSRSFIYDSLGRMSSATNPESATISYGYDSNGNVTSKTDANSTVTAITYDELNRVLKKVYTPGVHVATTTSVDCCYDHESGTVTTNGVTRDCTGVLSSTYPIGRLIKVSNGNAIRRVAYNDPLGRIMQLDQVFQSQPNNPFTFTYTYFPFGGVSSYTFPSGRVLQYHYDPANRVITLDGNPTTNDYRYADLTATGAYAPQGAIASVNLAAENLVEARHYNPRLQPVSIADSWGGTQQWLIQNSYSATGNNGNILGQTETRFGTTSWNQTYTYDNLNRLGTASEASGWQQTYVYDRFGNRAVLSGSYTPGGSEATMTPEVSSNTESAVLAAYPSKNQWNGAMYDTAGNQLSINGVLTAIVYDAEGHMTQVTNGSEATSTYEYDGEGRRVQKTANGSTVQYVYDTNGELAAEYGDPAGSTGTKFPVEDHLGSVRGEINLSGTSEECYDYLPFGETVTGFGRTNTCFTPPANPDTAMKFTGKERDAESGLDFFGARYFSGAQGRFTSADQPFADQGPSDPQSWNLYNYARNNPLRYTDADGRECVTLDNGATGDNGKGSVCQAVVDADKKKKPDITVTANQYGSTYAFDFRGNYIPGSFRPPSAKETGIHDDTVNLAVNLSLVGDAAKLGMVLDAGAIDLGKIMGILREAAAEKGNFGLGEATAAEAEAAGKAWVGEGAKVASDGKTMVSNNGLKQYRPPTFKPNEGKVQANFESRPQGSTQWQSNGHLDIK